MLDNFVLDCLLERAEVELSHRIINGYYPQTWVDEIADSVTAIPDRNALPVYSV